MILVDTSVIVAWLDRTHEDHRECAQALEHWAGDRKPVLPDFLIRAQAAALDCKHLTNDRRRLAAFPEVEFIFPD